MSSTKIEFAVQMTCQSCETAVRQALECTEGVTAVQIDRSTNSVVVETTLPYSEIQSRIASTGRKVVVKGLGSAAGVAMLDTGSEYIQGVVRFVQMDPKLCIVDGTIDGLKPGVKHLLAIHECGDTSKGCESVGDYFDPRGPRTNGRVYGKLTTLTPEANGRSKFRLEDNALSLTEVIGRALVISEIGKNESAKKLSCGVIARSAGLFQNPKTICACDGVSLWDEKNSPQTLKSGA